MLPRAHERFLKKDLLGFRSLSNLTLLLILISRVVKTEIDMTIKQEKLNSHMASYEPAET